MSTTQKVPLPAEVPESPPTVIDMNETSRACMECDLIYIGKIRCPECNAVAGEPIEYIGGLGVYV